MEQDVTRTEPNYAGLIFYEKSESITKMAKPLADALGVMKNAPNTREGYGYKYAPLNEILDTARPILQKHGLGLVQLVSTGENTVNIQTVLIHTSGEYISCQMDIPPTDVKGTSQIQKMGASITYARRYMLTAMLGIAGEEDTDGVTPGEAYQKKQGMPEPPPVTAKGKAPAPAKVQKEAKPAEGKKEPPQKKPESLKDRLESAVKMIDQLINDNKGKLSESSIDFLDRQYEDIRSLPDSQDKYLQYRDFYQFIIKTVKEEGSGQEG